MTIRSRTHLTQILASITRIESYSAGGVASFFDSSLLQDGIVHHLELIGASVKELPTGLPTSHSDVPWSSIARMRDRLAHHYLDLDLEIVWEVVAHDLPPLKEAVEAILRTLDQTSP